MQVCQKSWARRGQSIEVVKGGGNSEGTASWLTQRVKKWMVS